jgi:hypothetical protein
MLGIAFRALGNDEDSHFLKPFGGPEHEFV